MLLDLEILFLTVKNLTVTCMFIAIFKINIKAIFDEITVTFHPIIPNNPIIIITEVAHPANGIITHLKFLKMNHNVSTIKIKTPIPKL